MSKKTNKQKTKQKIAKNVTYDDLALTPRIVVVVEQRSWSFDFGRVGIRVYSFSDEKELLGLVGYVLLIQVFIGGKSRWKETVSVSYNVSLLLMFSRHTQCYRESFYKVTRHFDCL